jgi:hypothetical protein
MRIAMLVHRIIRVGLAALAVGALGQAALAQQDIQITSEAISRACADIHHTPQVSVEAPTIRGPSDITLNCRLIGAGGTTIAQVSPAEVCQRINGSTEWYRGMGTQVYCRAAAGGTPAPRSFTINQDDIAKACQRTHRNPQATAEPATVGRYGLELNCRLVNQNGVTLARVSPEDVCEAKFGTREWMGVLGSTTFVCKGTPIDTARSDGLPHKGGGGGGGGGSAGEAFNDVPLTPDAITKGCRILHGADATAGPAALGREPTINCITARGPVRHTAAEFCPKLSGTGEWYLTDFGRGTWLPGETPGAAPRFHVCRGPGPLQYHALADIGRYCNGKGYRFGNYGTTANKPPFCSNGGGSLVPVTIADICRDVHRAGAHGGRGHQSSGVVYLCLPAGEPAPVVATTSVIPGTEECSHCGPLASSIARHEQQIKDQDKRIADEEADKRKHEEGLKSLRGRERQDWKNIVDASAARIADTKKLRAEMQAALDDRKAQLAELQARHAQSGHTKPPSPEPAAKPVEQPASPPEPTFKTVERPRSPPEPTFKTVERPRSPPEPTFKTVERTGPPQPEAGASASSKRLCEDHVAELTNGQRVFHRLYVIGEPKGKAEAEAWYRDVNLLAFTLTSPGRQKLGSTSILREQPTKAEFKREIERLKEVALPCHEVTIFLTGHGVGGAQHGLTAERVRAAGETHGEGFLMREKSGDDWSVLFDKDMGEIMKGFKSNVSVTTLLSVCFGGGFAGPGNIEESDLVKVIGVYNVCPGDGAFDKAIRNGIDEGAGKATGARVTANELKAYLKRDRWPLGAPFDDKRDFEEVTRLPATGERTSR